VRLRRLQLNVLLQPLHDSSSIAGPQGPCWIRAQQEDESLVQVLPGLVGLVNECLISYRKAPEIMRGQQEGREQLVKLRRNVLSENLKPSQGN
jgi:hypothetical protein